MPNVNNKVIEDEKWVMGQYVVFQEFIADERAGTLEISHRHPLITFTFDLIVIYIRRTQIQNVITNQF